jgi:putative transposase
LWLPIKPHQPIDFSCGFCESKILKRDDDFFVYLVVQKEVKIEQKYSSVLAVDIGERVMATVLLDGKPIFYGREIRGIRRHYAWLRKRLGEKKLLKKIKQIKHKEQATVNQKLHEIAKDIVVLATKTDSAIVLGDLKGIRKSAKGRRMNRIVSNMPFYKLTEYIKYKANWQGIQVIKINERKTSHTCSKCGSEGKRPHQGLFVCPKCKYQANADFVSAQNIKKRFEDYMSSNGAIVTLPETLRGEAE